MKFTYLLVNILSVIVPFGFSFHPKIQFNKNFSAFVKANLITTILFLIWDIIFTARGVWSFNSDYTLGLRIINLPFEEILFFICIPFACVFTYHCFSAFFNIKWHPKFENIFVLIFSSLLFIIGFVNWNKAYTCVTFISTAAILLILKYYFNANWIGEFFSVYIVLLIPFFIVNGILTGTGLESPVVLYNNAENLGIRLLTIPIEDMVYAIELLLLNTFLYNHFKHRKDYKVSHNEP